jgi:hypothetical protein
MCRTFKSALGALTVLGATAAPVLACINDREVNKSEREFKSHYLDPQPLPGAGAPSDDSTDRGDLMVYGGMGTGTLFLIGAVVVGFRKSSRAS